eukprot:6488042-Pyramimonas_sp.AAC.1
MRLTGISKDNTLANLRPTYGDGPKGMTATKSPGNDGQGGDGDDKSEAPNNEIASSHEDDRGRRPRGSPPGSPGGSDPSHGGGGRRGLQGPGGPHNSIVIDESTPLDQWRQVGNNQKTDLLDIPDVTNIREWKMHAIRAIAGSSPESQVAQHWIAEAMGPAVEDEQLKEAGQFQRLDLMIATNLIEKFNKMRKSRYQPAHHTHSLQQVTRVEFSAQAEGGLVTGREMVRAICHWCSVRSELGQL